MKALMSKVPNHIGYCKPTWLNRNQVCNRLDGGISGFFKNVHSVWWWPLPVRYGEEFHGIIRGDAMVYPTKEHDE